MITDAARRIAELANKSTVVPLGRPSFEPKERYRVMDFSNENFERIQKSDKGGSISFIDGGNLPVISTPSFSVHFERIYFNCFQSGVRVKPEIQNRIEFFTVSTVRAGEALSYETFFVPLRRTDKDMLPDEADLVFDSYDDSIRTGHERIALSRAGDVARSFAEWRLAEILSKDLCEGDIIVRDGTLHAPYTNQTKYAEAAYSKAKKNGVVFSGVSKTSQLYTTTGLPLTAAIARLSRESDAKAPWYYSNLVEITDPAHKADISFAKLHQRSDYLFRVEILKSQEDSKDLLMAALAENSKDLSFPGYPYGLIDADKNARVSYDELSGLRMLLLSEISKAGDFEDFKDFINASDAHDWLNRVV